MKRLNKFLKYLKNLYGKYPPESQFEKLAKEYSEERIKVHRDKELGYFSLDSAQGQIAILAFKLFLGQMTNIIRDNKGYYLILNTDRKDYLLINRLTLFSFK